MTTYDFLQLVLHAAGDKIQGRTKLQKLVYFAGERAKCLDRLRYRPHYYGPYSPDVAAAVEDLRGLRFLDQRLSSCGAVDPSGFEVTRYDYELTEEGKTVAEEKAKQSPDQWKAIQEAVGKFAPVDYVKLSMAAKTYFLLGQAKDSATSDELQGMTDKFGWKVSSDQILEAGRLLESAGLISLTERS